MPACDASRGADRRLAVFGRRRPEARRPTAPVLGSRAVSRGLALDWSTCDRARIARDPRFDGWFFTGVATTGRVQRAKALVDQTALPMSSVAFAAGFASIRRFNAAFRAVYRRSPTAVRRVRWRRRPAPAIESRPRR